MVVKLMITFMMMMMMMMMITMVTTMIIMGEQSSLWRTIRVKSKCNSKK